MRRYFRRHWFSTQERLWVFFWVHRWRYFCLNCDSKGPWRSTQLEAISDGMDHCKSGLNFD